MIEIGSLTIHNVYDYTTEQLRSHYQRCSDLLLSGSVHRYQLACRDMTRIATDMVARCEIPNIRTRVWGI